MVLFSPLLREQQVQTEFQRDAFEHGLRPVLFSVMDVQLLFSGYLLTWNAQVGCFPRVCCKCALEGLTLLSGCNRSTFLADFSASLPMQIASFPMFFCINRSFGFLHLLLLQAFPAWKLPVSRPWCFPKKIPPSPVVALCRVAGLCDFSLHAVSWETHWPRGS